ncbi:MAG: MOSC domain-containing protein [Puniceicoccales bacterium]
MVERRIDVDVMKIWTSPGHDFKGRHGLGRLAHGVEPQPEIECVAGQGIVGDRFFGHKENFKGQITFFDADVADALERELNLAEFDRSAFRRNVLLRGVDLNELIGQQFRIGAVTFEGSEECSPCYWMDEAIAPGAFEWLKGRGGLRCRIIDSGCLKLGTAQLELIHE